MICARMCVYQIKHVTFLLTPQKDLNARSYAPLYVIKILIKWHDQAILY